MDSLLEQTNQMLSIMTTVIGAIAGISLLVGWDWGHEYHVWFL